MTTFTYPDRFTVLTTAGLLADDQQVSYTIEETDPGSPDVLHLADHHDGIVGTGSVAELLEFTDPHAPGPLAVCGCASWLGVEINDALVGPHGRYEVAEWITGFDDVGHNRVRRVAALRSRLGNRPAHSGHGGLERVAAAVAALAGTEIAHCRGTDEYRHWFAKTLLRGTQAWRSMSPGQVRTVTGLAELEVVSPPNLPAGWQPGDDVVGDPERAAAALAQPLVWVLATAAPFRDDLWAALVDVYPEHGNLGRIPAAALFTSVPPPDGYALLLDRGHSLEEVTTAFRVAGEPRLLPAVMTALEAAAA